MILIYELEKVFFGIMIFYVFYDYFIIFYASFYDFLMKFLCFFNDFFRPRRPNKIIKKKHIFFSLKKHKNFHKCL
jgi:hypothetical protein